MSALPKQTIVPVEPNTDALLSRPPQPRVGPSRRRRRANHRLGSIVALCAMGAWAVLGLMPVAAALFAYYGD